jgi:hypothetical protein
MSGAHYMNLSKPVSARQFAKMVGVSSDNSVRKAVERGSISKGYNEADKTFIPKIAAAEWGKEILPEFLDLPKNTTSTGAHQPNEVRTKEKKPRTTDPSLSSIARRLDAGEILEEAMAENLPEVSEDEVGNVEDDDIDLSGLDAYIKELGKKAAKAEAERYAAIYKAKILQLAYKEKRGQMVPMSKVNTVLFSYGQEIRVALEGISARVIDKIRATETRHEAIRVMDDEIFEMLTMLSDIMDRKFE